MPSLSMDVFGPAGVGGAPGDGEAAGAGAPEPGPGAGPGVSSGSALATTVDAAQPATIRLAASNLAAVGTPPIEIEGTGVKNLIHRCDTAEPQERLGEPPYATGVPERVFVGLEVVARNPRVHQAFEEEAQHRVVGVIRLVERQHGRAVGLLLERVISLGARPQRGTDGHIARQLVELGLGHRLPRRRPAPGQR